MAESLRTSKDNDKHRKRQKSRDKNDKSESKCIDEGRAESIPECAVCLQTCVHPAKLPCSHIFCFLCLKGLATQSRRCAMCRQDIPADYLDHPQLLEVPPQTEKEAFEDGYQWFYEGRSGWWQYDERTSRELETAFKSGQRTCELLIVGQLYIADFDAMLQLRRNDMSRRRRIKRDLASIPKKGIAGLRFDGSSSTHTDVGESIDIPSTSQQSAPLRSESDLSRSRRTSQDLTYSSDSWRNNIDTDFGEFLLSNQYRNREEAEDSDENEVLEIQADSAEVAEVASDDNEVNNVNAESDQAELESQLSELWLH